ALSGGGYVVFWSRDEGDGALSYFQRFSAEGVALGEETRVDPDFEGYVVAGAVAGLADGGFVATWIAEPRDGVGDLLFARFDAEGRQIGVARGVDTPTVGTEWFSAVTRLSDGGFAIAWSTSGDADERFSVRVRTFNADGTPRGAGFTVSTATTGHDFAPAVAALAGGGFVVTWLSIDDSVTPRILARLLDASGRAVGGVITVDQSSGSVGDLVADIDPADPSYYLTLAELVAPDVAAFEGGGLVVSAAARTDPDTPAAGLLHRFDATGTRLGTAVQVDTTGMSGLDVETLAGDVIVVTWMGVQDANAVSPDLDIFLRRFRGDGTPLGDTRLVNSSTDANQLIVELQALEGGGYVVVWSSEGQDLDDLGLFAQQYQQNGEVVRVEVRGTDGADVLFYIGDDPMRAEGLGCDDVYLVQRAQDQTIEQPGEGTDTVKAELNWTLSANLENLVLSGSANLSGGGNGLRNDITGNTGNNRLNGGAGADTLRGGAGNDTYFVDSRDDVVDEVSSTPASGPSPAGANGEESPAGTGSNVDTVVAQVTYTLSANVENLQLSGSKALDGSGNGLANIIAGNDGANRLSGNGGNDTIDGGKGNDTVLGGDGAD
ncbi:MAG: calcium-binding protein, partial [Gammaproteobacteria bacterium]